MASFVAQPLTEAQKKIVRDTVPVLERNGTEVASEFYRILFKKYPAAATFFNHTNQRLLRQPKILAYLLLRYAQCIDDLTPLHTFVVQIVNKHVGMQVQPEHYGLVGLALIDTFIALLGDGATKEFLGAWLAAYTNLAALLIDLEKEQYKKLGYTGFRDFTVVKMVRESPEVMLVYFAPLDPLFVIPEPLAGQYVCTRWQIPGQDDEVTREYLISWLPQNNMYRILVKHLPGGEVSTFIHTKLQVGYKLRVASPAGQYYYNNVPAQMHKEWVFIIGGIGITPNMPLMQRALENNIDVRLIWSNRYPETRPFVDVFNHWKEIYPNFNIEEYFTRSIKVDEAIDVGRLRRICKADLKFLDNNKHLVHLVGPRGFMNDIKSVLDLNGFTNITAEFYGPTLFLFFPKL